VQPHIQGTLCTVIGEIYDRMMRAARDSNSKTTVISFEEGRQVAAQVRGMLDSVNDSSGSGDEVDGDASRVPEPV
jgi:hypothetical protein